LADVERIEVIRGPGVVAWGSNAVNGVINIITKKSSDTQGALIQNGGGNQERDFNTARYGARPTDDFTWAGLWPAVRSEQRLERYRHR